MTLEARQCAGYVDARDAFESVFLQVSLRYFPVVAAGKAFLFLPGVVETFLRFGWRIVSEMSWVSGSRPSRSVRIS